MLEKAAIRALRVGVVPPSNIEALSAGYESLKGIIDQALLGLRNGKRTRALYLRGEWGTGKTHSLSYIREVARAGGTPTALLNFNGRSAALNHPQRYYGYLCSSMSVDHGNPGLRSIVLTSLETQSRRSFLSTFANSIEAGELGPPLRALCWTYEQGHSLRVIDHPAWQILLGADLGWADYTYKRERALSRLDCVGKMFRALGMGGLVLLLDEVETLDQLWNVRSRLSAYSVLATISALQAVWPVFGITERFERAIESDRARGAMAYDFAAEGARWFLNAWEKRQMLIVDVPCLDKRSARSLAGSVHELYEHAYGRKPLHGSVVAEALSEWYGNPSRNPRRLIRLIVHKLDTCR